MKLKHIELFAGCGGMSLGLESAGYELFFANELSPMAAATFAFNLLEEDIEGSMELDKTLWIKSQYSLGEREKRLRENPEVATKGRYSDLNAFVDLQGKLLIGDINLLLQHLEENPEVAERISNMDIDVLSGGPPCQSFSLAGKREKNNSKNTLPLSFSKIAGLLKPKAVILENVRGITSPFTDIEGNKYYAWFEVSKAFAQKDFVPVCMMLNSKYFAVPQNRPRFIMIAYRKDVFDKIYLNISAEKFPILTQSLEFFNKVTKSIEEVVLSDLDYYDIEVRPELFDGEIFPKINNVKENFISASDAIEDIADVTKSYRLGKIKGIYGVWLNQIFDKKELGEGSLIKNHDPRFHGYNVKARFRIYQVISLLDNQLRNTAVRLLAGKTVPDIEKETLFKKLLNHEFLFREGNEDCLKKPANIKEVEILFSALSSKKHSQRALKKAEPAPAQLTIPDDLCHYKKRHLRTLTVREMARFQSFPDWYEFKSKVTTGGVNRKFEVPQYTQVGNAVPPLLAKALGEVVKEQLEEVFRPELSKERTLINQ